MRIRKVSFKGTTVGIGWQIERKKAGEEGGFDSFSLSCKDKPLPAFHGALRDMATAAGKILGLPSTWAAALSVNSVKITYSKKDGSKTVAAACSRNVDDKHGAEKPAALSVPDVLAESWGPALDTLEREAKRYVEGEGMQLQLIADPKADAAADAEKAELVNKAAGAILAAGRATVSVIQRRLKCSYTVACDLMAALETAGIVGPPNGEDPREILKKGESQVAAG